MATNQHSQGGARSQRHIHPPTPQPEEQQQQQRIARTGERQSLRPTSIASFARASADIETMWQRVIQSVDMAGDHLTQSESPRRAQRVNLGGGSPHVARDESRRADSSEARNNAEDSNNNEDNANERTSIQHVDGWTFVNLRPRDISHPSEPSPPPRVRRRLARAPSSRSSREGASRPVQLPQFLGATVQSRGPSHRLRDANDSVHIDDIQIPVTRGPTLLFGTEDVDDNIDSERSLSDDAEDYGDVGAELNADPDDFDDWFVRSFSNNMLSQATNTTRSGLIARLHRAGLSVPSYSTPKGPGATTIVRQPWNRDRLWRPYIYQHPIADPLGRFGDAGGRSKNGALSEADIDSMRLYTINSGIKPLSLKCTNADDMGRGSLNNLFFPNSSLFLTSRAKNVNLEISFDSDPSSASSRTHHHVVERILVMSSMVAPPCTELMVFASSRRCNFSELSKYDNFTFADYERLSAKFASKTTKSLLKDPLPIAYFWLSIEEEYEQLQNLPQGICCKYLYFKLLRGDSSDPKMSLRMIRVFGWDGPRTFSDAAIC
ncbi:hypothetical protein COEREDRAFT_81314 [Coemansia reversa NRRL 1564]|uniref:Uncharacterized protein n=1 Tax=Coemansia reversa (strain ATCC 12441 / NRRL 1564) TaxID=763665 RepID=A0A2G5BBF7_COERN|nr:hypothetical protein COEREDRAFT_81314 [Coemansia reversa NRRL 1564]|eukprot:PIA16343.1 hypothetical protein COEREDRAFT_81314 [Coemansia reversa NRRL 1564]